MHQTGPGTTKVKINPETGTLIREGVEAVVNPFDEYAIEEALRIKERVGGCVKVITMGPPQADEALKAAIALGADESFLDNRPRICGVGHLGNVLHGRQRHTGPWPRCTSLFAESRPSTVTPPRWARESRKCSIFPLWLGP